MARNPYLIDRGRAARAWVVPLAIGIALCTVSSASARVVGDIVSIGYRTSGVGGVGAGPVVRVGQWVPVVVDLSLEGQATFNGSLRIRQRDSDGDFCYDEVGVYLRADSGPQKTCWLYAVAGLLPNASDYCVTLMDENGEAVSLVSGGKIVRQLEPPAEPQVLPDEHYLIACLTPGDRPIGKITRLVGLDQADRFWRPLHITHITPSRMPTHWIGLEMIDCIVWDEADATALTRPQLAALIDWVKHGGKLLIASAKTANTLAQSEWIGPLLPVDVGKVVSTDQLPTLRHRLLGVSPDEDSGYRRPIPVAYCTLRNETGTCEILTETAPNGNADAGANPAAGSVLAARRRVDRGEVIFVGAALRDVLRGKGVPSLIFLRVLGLRESVAREVLSFRQLFPRVQDRVGFARKGGAYMVLAFLFALAYLAVSTFGSWSFLKSRGWIRHSWAVFAAVAAAASAVSVLGVQTVRGIGQELHQLTIVDVEAGRYDARATSYFGLKTGTHTKLDVWMPSNYPLETEPGPSHGFLKPLAELHAEGLPTQGSFTDPGAYRLVPAGAEVRDVPIRATLKRFEGRWQGVLSGKVQASIGISRNKALRADSLLDELEAKAPLHADVFTAGSTITNNLGVDLEKCYVLQATKNVFEGRSFAAYSPRAGFESFGPFIYAHQIRGGIKDGETVDLVERIYRDADGRSLSPETWLKRNSLRAALHDWARIARLTGLLSGREGGRKFEVEAYHAALLLLTTLSECDPRSLKGGYGQPGLRLLDERCRQLDLSDLLAKDVVILVGLAEEPGPVKLCTRKGNRRYRPVDPSKAWTIYRVVIPVTQ